MSVTDTNSILHDVLARRTTPRGGKDRNPAGSNGVTPKNPPEDS
jgi:hypothetical protein